MVRKTNIINDSNILPDEERPSNDNSKETHQQSPEEVRAISQHFKERLKLALDNSVEPTASPIAELKESLKTIEGRNSSYNVLSNIIARKTNQLSQEYTATPAINQFHLRYKLESFVHQMASRGLLKISGHVLFLDEKIKDRKNVKTFLAALSHIHTDIYNLNEEDKPDYANAERDILLSGLSALYEIRDSKGQAVNLHEFLNLRENYKFTGNERVNNLREGLLQRKALRLSLHGRNDRISLADVDKNIDPQNGYLCILDESGQFYRKITSYEIFSMAGMSQGNPDDLEMFYGESLGLRRSDISQQKYAYKSLTDKFRSPIVRQKFYTLPSREFTPAGSDEPVKIDCTKDGFITLSPDYSVLRMERFGQKQYLLLQHLEDSDLNDFQRAALTKYSGANVPVNQAESRLRLFDITDFIPVRSDETPQQYAKKVLKFSDLDNLTNLYRQLFDIAGFELQQFPLGQQLGFAVFYQSSSAEQRSKIHGYLKSLGANFFKAFQLCNHQLNLGQEIMSIAEKHGDKAKDLLVYISSILDIDRNKSKLLGHVEEMNQSKFHTIVAKKAEGFIRDAAKLPVGADLEKFISEAEQYHLPVIAQGAEFAAKIQKEVKETVPMAELAKVLDQTVLTNLPAGSLVKSTDPDRLFDPDNYTNPDLFNHRDAAMVAENLQRAYAKIDPEWLIYLRNNILKDLANPNVTFVTIRDKKDKRLLGLVKTRPDGSEGKEYYIGTMYVDKAYQSQYNFGDYLQFMAENNIPDRKPYWGSAAVSNPAISRHIDHAGATASAIVFEGDEKHHSKELFKLNFRKNPNWKTKNHRLFPKDKIIAIADGKKQLESEYSETIKVLKTSTLPAGEKDLINLVQPYFQTGWHITRYFQSESGLEKGKQYLYLALEKLDSKQSGQPSDQKAA